MKRRSQKEQPRDREMEQVRAMTTVTMTQDDHRSRLLADKARIEEALKEAFANRNRLRQVDKRYYRQLILDFDVRIKALTAELRDVKRRM